MKEGILTPEPENILDRRLKKKGNRARVDFLVQWKGANEEDATWMDGEKLSMTYLELVGEFF